MGRNNVTTEISSLWIKRSTWLSLRVLKCLLKIMLQSITRFYSLYSGLKIWLCNQFWSNGVTKYFTFNKYFTDTDFK
jgi:hypothetical protein